MSQLEAMQKQFDKALKRLAETLKEKKALPFMILLLNAIPLLKDLNSLLI